MSTATAPQSRTAALEMRGIGKSFLGVSVLQDVDLEAMPSEVHAIVGENGAGKSTLMKVLAGVYQPDAGQVLIGGESVSFSHPSAAQDAGVAIIYQEFNLLPDRSVAENVFVGREPTRRGLLDRRAMNERTAELMADVGERSFEPRSLVRSLSVAQQQVVEILKALSQDARIVVMDEPTAALAENEVDLLLALVRRLRERGIAVLYISHRLNEVFAVADRITVLKDGRKVATTTPSEVTGPGLVKLMVGRELDAYFPPRAESEPGDVRLRVRGGANAKLRGVNLELRAHEIVGLAGLQGSGRTELARAIFGADPFQEGTLEIDGEEKRIRSPRKAIGSGIALISEDRKAEGLALQQSVHDNMLLTLRSVAGGQTRRHGGAISVSELAESVGLRARSPEQEVRFLSGGNQQKVVLAKWLATEPRVLLFDEPTRGIDVGAKAGIHDLMRKLADEGTAVLMISSELPEVIGMADRVLVMRGGEIAGEVPAGASEERIMGMATGQEEDERP